jgi:DMSO/TMAO reductase YedYZ molybdopterin-dependent catalytic subunit
MGKDNQRRRRAATAEGTPVGRRVFLAMVGLGAAGVVTGPRVQSGIDVLLRPVAARSGGLAGLLPGAGGFRLYTVTSGYPWRSPADYRLTVGGLVERPLELTLDGLRSLPPTRLVRPFQCVTGWRVPGVHWQGVALSHLLDMAGVKPGATALRFTSFDGVYSESLTIPQARRPDVIAAYSMLGGPVTRDHGGPVRLYVAPMYGYKSLKWLQSISVTSQVEPGYWEQYGYAVNGWVGRSNGRDDPPT